MIKYNIRQTYIDENGETQFRYSALTIVYDKRGVDKYCILNITESTIWIYHFDSYKKAENYIYNLPDFEVIEETDTEKVSDILIQNQYSLPSKLWYLAERYLKVTWDQAIKLYECAVRETIITNSAKHLYDNEAGLGWGRGLFKARHRFEALLQETDDLN